MGQTNKTRAPLCLRVLYPFDITTFSSFLLYALFVKLLRQNCAEWNRSISR